VETDTVNKDLAPPNSEAMKKAQRSWREKGAVLSRLRYGSHSQGRTVQLVFSS
jgi:hypothetical protein